MSSIVITLKRDKDSWELISPNGIMLKRWREKYPHKAAEYARAWISTWSDWTLRIDDEIKMPTEIDK